jgi:hypothetical protein
MPVVVAREAVSATVVVAIKVPKTAVDDSFEADDGMLVPLVRFGQGVNGGYVNFFVHTNRLHDIIGRTITAEMTLMKKVLDDGRLYYYVDLQLRDRSIEATHRVVVMPPNQPMVPVGDYEQYELPTPLQGCVYIMAAGAVLVPRQSPTPPQALSATGDTQLDRLLSQGWSIDSEEKHFVILKKGDGENARSIKHYRPKKSGATVKPKKR